MLKIHKFNKRLKAPNKNVKEDYQKANQSSITNSSMNSSSLSRIIKTEEDLLFKTDRKMPNEKSIYTRQRIDCFLLIMLILLSVVAIIIFFVIKSSS